MAGGTEKTQALLAYKYVYTRLSSHIGRFFLIVFFIYFRLFLSWIGWSFEKKEKEHSSSQPL